VGYAEFLVKPNIWEFLRKTDGTYAVSRNSELLFDSIPEKLFEWEICVRYGFCGGECRQICEHLKNHEKCTVDLSSSSPTHLAVS
jgi:hypothetical protein